jgi:glutathione S-transferase
MPARLYLVHGSHPCVTVERALQLKGIPYKTVEISPALHIPVMRVLFGGRTVPGVKFEDGVKVQESRMILREVERRVPEPPLYTGPAVEEAEQWGDDVLQPIGRTMTWGAFSRHPRAMYSYQEGAKLPKLPMPVVRASAPLITAVERKHNKVDDARIQRELQELPGHLDRIDAWIADGTLGGDQPNAADLQIAPTIALLMTLGDIRPLIEGRPAATLVSKYIEPFSGVTPPGVLPAEWIPAVSAAAAPA